LEIALSYSCKDTRWRVYLWWLFKFSLDSAKNITAPTPAKKQHASYRGIRSTIFQSDEMEYRFHRHTHTHTHTHIRINMHAHIRASCPYLKYFILNVTLRREWYNNRRIPNFLVWKRTITNASFLLEFQSCLLFVSSSPKFWSIIMDAAQKVMKRWRRSSKNKIVLHSNVSIEITQRTDTKRTVEKHPIRLRHSLGKWNEAKLYFEINSH